MNKKVMIIIGSIIVVVIAIIAIIFIGISLNNKKDNDINNNSNNNNTNNSVELSEWKAVINDVDRMFEEDEQTAFDNAMKEYKDSELKPIAVLATQVVSGTNYMFFCKETLDGVDGYAVVVIYKDLQGNSRLTHISEFNIENYVDKDNELNAKESVGVWQVQIPGKPYMLDEDIQASFDQANEKIDGVDYYPIKTIAKNKNKYGILSYGRLNDENKTEGVFVITLNTKTNKFETIYALDLGEFNQ